jgi:hypothetical protein
MHRTKILRTLEISFKGKRLVRTQNNWVWARTERRQEVMKELARHLNGKTAGRESRLETLCTLIHAIHKGYGSRIYPPTY